MGAVNVDRRYVLAEQSARKYRDKVAGCRQFAARLSPGETPAMRPGDEGEVPAQPLRARLADMQLSTDGAYRRNLISCQLSREHDCGALAKRIDGGAIIMHAWRNRRHLSAAYDQINRHAVPAAAAPGNQRPRNVTKKKTAYQGINA